MLEEAVQETSGPTPLPVVGPIPLIYKVQGLSLSVRAWVQGWVSEAALCHPASMQGNQRQPCHVIAPGLDLSNRGAVVTRGAPPGTWGCPVHH